MSDLRKAAQMALKFCETLGENHWGDRKEVVYTLRAALAQPEQDLQLVANFLKEYGLAVLEVIAALKTQPEQEPVAWLYEYTNPRREKAVGFYPSQVNGVICTPLYTAPPQRKPLTEEEIFRVAYAEFPYWSQDIQSAFVTQFARAIERAHGIGGEHE